MAGNGCNNEGYEKPICRYNLNAKEGNGSIERFSNIFKSMTDVCGVWR